MNNEYDENGNRKLGRLISVLNIETKEEKEEKEDNNRNKQYVQEFSGNYDFLVKNT